MRRKTLSPRLLQAIKAGGVVFVSSGLFACAGGNQSSSSTGEVPSSSNIESSSSRVVVSSTSAVLSSASVSAVASSRLSDASSSSEVVFSSSSVVTNPTANSLLSDGSFEQDLAQFTTPNLVNAAVSSGSGFLDFTISAVSDQNWEVELVHPVAVTVNTTYTLCFDGKADSNRNILFHIDGDEDSNWQVISGQSDTQALTAAWASYSKALTVSATDATARVQFMLGGSDVDVQLDNIGLYEGLVCGGEDVGSSTPVQSSSPQQSSVPASSLPVVSSSTSFSSVGIVADIQRGKDQAEALCLGCHGANDWTITDANRAQLISDTDTLMPPTNSQLCGIQCATDVIAYLEDLQNSNTSSSSSSDSGSLPHIEGQAIFDAQCQSCHSGARTTGIFRGGDYDLAIAKLTEKGLYSQSALSTYIAQEMPRNNAEQCNADCADKVTAYIASWHILPIDPQFADNSLPRSQPERKALSCGQAQGYGERLVRMLTREEYANTVRDLFGYSDNALSSFLPQDDTRGKFVNNKNITLRTDIEYSSVVQLAEAIAQQAKDTNFTWLNCASVDDSCAQRLVNEYGTYIFRRPLTDAEKNGSADVAGYLSIARGEHTDADIAEGMKVALGAMLSSPQFLYRHEMGEVANDVYQLSSYEMASFLSYTFTRSTPVPGSSLWQAAENNQLNSAATIRAEAGKLLATDAAKAIMGELVHDWLSTRSVLKSNKDEALFGDFGPIAEDMVTELSELFKDVMLDENATFADLYAPGKTYVNSRLAQHYGIDGVNGNGFQEVATTDRGGLLLNGAFLAYRGDPTETSPIRRATYIRRDMLCQYMPPPPAGVSTARDSQKEAIETFINDVRTTNRAAFHRLTESTTCAECHSELINPLGFGLENYDSVGRLRSVDNAGNTIDASGALFSPFIELHFFGDEGRNTEHYSFNGGQELAAMLASGEASGLAKSCVAMQFYNYATGIVVDSITESDNPLADTLSQDEVAGYSCDINNMVTEINQGSPRAMLEVLGTLNSIRFRKAF